MVEQKYDDNEPKYDDNEPINPTRMAMSMLDPEEGEKNDRIGFIRKVYGILSV